MHNKPTSPSMRHVLLALLTIASPVTCQSNVSVAQDVSSRAGDLAMFRTQFFEKDKSYSDNERANAEALLQQLEADPDELSVAEFHLALARIAALTRLPPPREVSPLSPPRV